MNRLFRTALAVISIMFVFVGCNQTEPENNPGSNNQQTTHITTNTTIPGTKISASSLADLQMQIDNTSENVVDLSLCSINESGSLTINKAITVRNFSSETTGITVSSGNVTLTGLNVSNVSTSGSGSNSLKIANSSLANLTLGGNSANSNMIVQSRGGSSVSKVSLVNASVSGTVTFKESVEMDVYGFGSNISSFEVEGQVSVTVNMTESAYSETNIQVEGITFTQNISDDQVYAQTDEYGPAGGDKTYTSATFPSAAMQYVSKLVNGYVSGTPSFPMPSLTDSETAKTKYEYRMMTAADMADELSAMQEMMTFDVRSLAVLIPSDRNFNESNYKSALESAGFKYNEDAKAYICSNMSDLENMYNSDTMSDNPYEAINALNSIKNKKFYRLQVNISTDERYCNISFTSVIMEYNFDFSDLIYGDYTD